MGNLEKRLTDLEAKAASTDHSVKMFLCNDGQNKAQARAIAGIPPDYAGKVVCIQFVEPPSTLKEIHHGND